MAISWYRGTVFDAGNSASVNNVNVRNQIKANLLAHASGAWSEVETYVVGTYSHLVLKCAAAQSGLGADFYVVLTLSTGGTTLYAMIGEGYNSSTHVLSKFAPGANTGNNRTTLNSDTTVSETYTLVAGISGGAYLTPYCPGINVTASVDLWMQMSERHFTMGFGSTTASVFYVGAIVDTFLGTDDPMPIGVSGGEHQTSSGVYTAMTRHPLLPTSAVPATTFYTHSQAGLAYTIAGAPAPRYALPAWAVTIGWTFWDKYWASGSMLAEALSPNNGVIQLGNNAATVQGVIRGKRRGVRISAAPSGGAYGDIVVAGGRTWFCVAVSGSYAFWLDTGV